MTIFDMLERLEAEIVSLRSRNRDLLKSLSQLESNGARKIHKPGTSGPKTKPQAKKRLQKGVQPKSKQQAPVSPANLPGQLDLPAGPELVPNGEGRVLGKRQALGKSLVQLRRLPSVRSQ